MHNQSVNSSVSRAAQLSIFLKGKVFAPPNPFSFSKRHDGIRLELAKFFAHGFAVITSNNCKRPCSPGQPYAGTIPAFRILFTRRLRYMRLSCENTADCSEIPTTGGLEAVVAQDFRMLRLNRQISCRTSPPEPDSVTPDEVVRSCKCGGNALVKVVLRRSRGTPSSSFPRLSAPRLAA